MSDDIFDILEKKPIIKKKENVKVHIRKPIEKPVAAINVDVDNNIRANEQAVVTDFFYTEQPTTENKIRDKTYLKMDYKTLFNEFITSSTPQQPQPQAQPATIEEKKETKSKTASKQPKKVEIDLITPPQQQEQEQEQPQQPQEQKQQQQEQSEPTKKATRKKTVTKTKAQQQNEEKSSMFNEKYNIEERLSYKQPLPLLKSSDYYLENRQHFIEFINNLFKKYKKDIENEQVSNENQCEQTDENDISPMTHQKIIKDYVNLYTPYRGLLLYHGLGAGKTCASIGIAEGMKTAKNVIVMTPASLQMNYIVELKKCGDNLYKKNQYWEFINLSDDNEMREFSKILNIDYADIKKKKGVWMVNKSVKEANYDTLSNENKKSLDEQIDKMIKNKYKFIAYNGIRWDNLNELTKQYTINPFDNKVVIIDEAHNFVSRIINKLRYEKERPATAGTDNIEISKEIKKTKDTQVLYSKQNKILNELKQRLKAANDELILLKQKEQEQRIKEDNIKKLNIQIKEIDTELSREKETMKKIKKEKSQNKNNLGNLSCKLYEYLMNAENCKIILLSGTPLINYPNEIAVLFNILRGKIKTWNFKLADIKKLYTNNDFEKNLIVNNREIIYDYISYNKNTHILTITRNPFGFVKSVDENGNYNGVHLSEIGNITNDQFVENITKLLKERMGIKISEYKMETYKALPDNKEEFIKYFIDEKTNAMNNENLFKRRVLGLTSYFRSAQEALMPSYDKNKNLHIFKIEMSDHQLGLYNEARMVERDQEKNNKLGSGKGGDSLFNEEQTSTYRIFSRAFCNFVFPNQIKRPFPKEEDTLATALSKNKTISEDALDGVRIEELEDSIYDEDDIENEKEEMEDEEFEEEINSIKKGKTAVKEKTYNQRIALAMRKLSTKSKDGKTSLFLSKDKLGEYSPKFLKMLETITERMDSLHLIYTQFRTLEGIGILKMVLEANGFVQFKTKLHPQTKEVVLDLEMTQNEDGTYKLAKPTFVLYTGTETKQEKELTRNIFNGNWKYVPESLAKQLKSISNNNMYGDIIKIFMITASGAEGISLKNVRYVHITEPYWHPVRMEQVIGRAKRICSHQDLPKELRTVDVFLYLMKLSEKQLKDAPIELKLKDNSETSDETLYNISIRKEKITESILRAVKETAIDCAIHKKEDDELKCFTFASSKDLNKIAYIPQVEKDEEVKQVVREEVLKIREENLKGKLFYVNTDTLVLYDPDSYNMYKKMNNDMSALKIIGKKVPIEIDNKQTFKYEIVPKDKIIVVNVKDNNDYSDVYRQKQESLGCGRHAINNVIGKNAFTKFEMLEICDNITKDIGAENKKDVCDIKNEFYSPEVLINTLKTINVNGEMIYKSVDPKTGEEQMTIEYIKKRVNEIEKDGNNVIGFVINADENQHYYAMKKLNAKSSDAVNAKYLKIDSLNSKNNLSVFTMNEFGDIKTSKGVIILHKKKPIRTEPISVNQ